MASPSTVPALFSSVESDVATGNWTNIVKAFEKYEMEFVWQTEIPVEFYQFFLLACIAADTLPTARHLQHRAPAKVKSDAGFTQTYYVVQHLWNNRIAAAQRQLRNIPYPDVLQNAVTSAVEALRTRTLNLYSKAYTTISVNDLASALGVSGTEAVERATKAGALREVQNDLAHLKPVALVASGEALTDLTTLQKLANHVLFVEK